MITLRETQQRIEADPKHWSVYLMDFVDDFRYYRDPTEIAEPKAIALAESPLSFRWRKIFVTESFLSRV